MVARSISVKARRSSPMPRLVGLLLQQLRLLLEVAGGALLERLGDLLVEALDLRQLVDLAVGHVLDGAVALGGQQLGDHLLDVQGLDEQLGGFAELAVAPLAVLALGHDVDVPAGELRGEPDILAAPADGDVLHVIGHDHLDPPGLGVEHDLAHLGRAPGR